MSGLVPERFIAPLQISWRLMFELRMSLDFLAYFVGNPVVEKASVPAQIRSNFGGNWLVVLCLRMAYLHKFI